MRNQFAEAAAAYRPTRVRSALLLFLVLLFVALVVSRNIEKGEFNLNVDETLHAVTGLYFADFLTDLPLAHPIQYTYEYYAQYPALGLIHWPPLFHFVEGLLFLLLGPSVVSARLTVLIFALFGFYFWFKLVSEFRDTITATASTVILAFVPTVLLYEKSVALEIPSLALCLAAIYFWVRYLRTGAARPLYWFALFASLALLTKQQSIFLAPFCLFTLLATRKWSLLRNWSMLPALGLCLLLVVPFYGLAFAVHGQTVVDHVVVRTRGGAVAGLGNWLANPGRLTFYLETVPDQLGLPLLGLSILGIATSWWWDRRDNIAVMLMWIVACYVTLASLNARAPRYAIYWLPPLIYFAVSPLLEKFRPSWIRVATVLVLVLLVANQAMGAWTYERPYVSGYAPLARHLVDNNESGILLYDGALPGNFIFYIRAYDPERRFVVMRKALYVTRIIARYGYRELITTRAELQKLMEDYGIKYIIISDGIPLRFEGQKILRELLQTPQFQLVKQFPVQSNQAWWRVRHLFLYENKQAHPRSTNQLRLEMLTLDRDIVVSLDGMRLK